MIIQPEPEKTASGCFFFELEIEFVLRPLNLL